MNENIRSINHTLQTAHAGDGSDDYDNTHSYNVEGDKTWEIRLWIGVLILKIVCYKEEHKRLMEEAATTP